MARMKLSPGQAKVLGTLLGGMGMGVVGGVTEGIVGTLTSSELKKRDRKREGRMHKVAFVIAFIDELDKLAMRVKRIPVGSKVAPTPTVPQLPTPPSAGSTVPTS